MKIGLIAVFFFCLLEVFLLPREIFAGVTINEFNAHSSTEWVEFYNPDTIDISSYWLDDDLLFTDDVGSGAKKNLSGLNISNQVFPYLSFSNFLNNGGDYVVLFSPDGSVVDQYQYTSDPGENITIGRNPDGTGDWAILSLATLGGANAPLPTPTPTPTPTATPSPTPQPSPTASAGKATYKVNEVKNTDGNVLSSVQIYVDNVYVHHFAPETLTFCDDCDYKYGSHTITLQKTGYVNWAEAKTFSSGNTFEVNPIMQVSAPTVSPTSTPTPTPTVQTSKLGVSTTPTPTPKPTIVARSDLATQSPTLSSGEVLGTESAKTSEILPEKQNPPFVAAGLILFGLSLILGSVVKYPHGIKIGGANP